MRQHGTRSCYVHGPAPGAGRGCRCEPCREANSDYVNHVDRMKAYGRWEPWAPSEMLEEVRQHLANLRRLGVGYKTVARAAGMSVSNVDRIRRGTRVRIRPETAARILAVTSSARAAHSIVDAGPTWVLIDRLLAAGYRRYEIARWLGNESPALQLSRDRILERHARRIREIYEAIWKVDPKLRALDGVNDEEARRVRACRRNAKEVNAEANSSR